MDLKVKSLLDEITKSPKNEEKNYQLLREILQTFNEIDNSQFSGDLPESVSTDMYIKCAQLAYKNKNYDIAEQSIKFYFTKAPAADLQKCDAYLCLAKLSASTSNTELLKLKESSENILRAISMALKNPSLSGKIYEASTLFWRFCYRFLRPGYHTYVAYPLSKIVYALNEISDPNFEWRAILSITLIECYIESNQTEAAIAAVPPIFPFIKQNAPSQLTKLFQLVVTHQLMDSAEIQKEIKASLELSVCHSMCQIMQHFENKENKMNYRKELLMILSILDVPLEGQNVDDSSQVNPPGHEHTRSKKERTKSPKTRAFKSPRKTLLRSPHRPHFLLEVARLCLKLDFPELAQICIHAAKSSVFESSFNIQLEYVNCELLVRSLGNKQESYRKKSVQTRLAAIKHCEDNLIKAIRQNDKPSIQYGCITIWNLSLPLLMWNLRSYLHKPLTLVAQALEDIECLFMQLRCQVHLELAQCEEEREHIRVAIKHLHKAMELDESGLYWEKMERKLHRLTLRSELYKQPERNEDIAAMIIEQASTASNTGSGERKRALLMKAGKTLAPYSFHLVLDSEKLFHDIHTKLMPRNSKQLAKCVHHYNANICKSEGHLRALDDKSNDIERLHLWADLVKIARKQEVWDVCRTATQFCLLYDDGRWQAYREKDTNSKTTPPENVGTPGKNEEMSSDNTSSPKKLNSLEFEKSSLAEREQIRLLAEINFIRGEALIHFLRKDNIELNDEPVFPTDISKRPKSHSSIIPAEDKNWNIYLEWVAQLNSKITACFLRGLEHGTSLKETCLVGNAAVYYWNYSTHFIRQSRYSEITETLNSILEGFKKVGYKGFEQLLINICTALVYGFITPWMPAPLEEKVPSPISPTKGKPSARKVVRKSSVILILPEAAPYIKKAIEVCEFAMEAINDKDAKKLISQSAKMSLLKVWVISKQMALQQIGKIWSKNEDGSIDDEKLITQIIVYLEMHSLTKNGVMEFRDLPSLPDIVSIMEKCSWNDNLVKLQLLTCLAYLLFNQKMHDRIIQVVQPVTNSYLEALSSKEKIKKKTTPILNPSESEKVSQLFLVMGQSLQESSSEQSILHLEVMDSYMNAAKFGCIAGNYELVITSAHYFWNTIFHIYNIRSQRGNLRKHLEQILSSISEVISKCHTEHAKKQPIINTPSLVKEPRITIYGPIGNFTNNEVILNKKEDLTLRVSLYNLLFQCYSDQEDWEKGLKVLDTAISELPSSHRLPLFRQRVLTKTLLGINMSLDFQKFKDEKEDFVSSLWRDIALNSQQLSDQLVAYQKAIEILVSDEYKWQKVDYLLEFGQWLYIHQFPISDVFDMMEWAVDILMGMQFEMPLPETPEESAKNLDTLPNAEVKKNDEKFTFKITQSHVTEDSDNPNTNPIYYVPQVKEILIGAQPLTTNLNVKNLNNIKQLDYLIKSHVLLSETYTPSSKFFYQYSLLAYDFVNQIWHLTFSNALLVIQDISIKETPLSSKSHEKGKEKSQPKKEKGNDRSGSPAKDKNKKKVFNPILLPQTPEEWAMFEFSEELLEAFKHESLKYCGINKSCFDQASLSVHYLIKLVANLRKLGLSHLALPVIVLCRVIAVNVLECKSLILLTHCKSMQISSELNLKSGSLLHETMVTRELENGIPDIIQMKETAERYKHENKMPNSIQETASLSELQRQKLTDAKSHLGIDLRNVNLYLIWIDVAEELIEESRYQKARLFLTESYKFADCFKDNFSKGRICYFIAKLAFIECQYKATFDFCLEIQKNYSTNEFYWYKSVLLLSKVVGQPSFMNDNQLAQNILSNAIEEFEKYACTKVNQALQLNLYQVKLQAKLSEIKAKAFLKKFDHLSEENVQEFIKSIECDFKASTDFLLHNNFNMEAIRVMEIQANTWHKIALKAKTNKSLQQKYYLECIDLLKIAISHTQNILYKIVAITSIDWQISLPVKRQLANFQLKYSTVLVEIEAIQLEEEIVKRKENENKDSILKTVEELTATTPVLFSYPKKWEESKCWIADEILSQASSAHYMTRAIPSLCSKSLLTIGHCLLQVSLWQHPDAPKTWLVAELEITQLGSENEQMGLENIQQTNNQENIFFSESSYVTSKNKKLLKSHRNLVNFIFQASECFLQSLDLALENKLLDTAMSACSGLVNLIGQYDNPICTQFLALYQSCSASIYLQNLLEESQKNPHSNRLAALLHQRKHLLKKDLKRNFSSSNLFGCLSHCLQTEWQAWKRCQVSGNHLSFSKEFPTNLYFVLLQHSPDKDFLYAMYMDKNKIAKSAASLKQQGASSSPSAAMHRAGVFGCPVKKQDLLRLLEMSRNFKKEAQNNYVRRSIQMKHQTQCLNMLEGLKYSMEDENQPIFEPILEVHDWMQDTFMNLIKSVEDYLAPILEPLTAALQTIIPVQASSVNAQVKEHREFLVVLADEDLLELPLEALSHFRQFAEVLSLSREISLQMFHHRLLAEPEPEEAKDGKKKDKKQQEAPSRLNPGGTKGPAKKGKKATLERTLPTWAQSINTASFKYIVDPFNECHEEADFSPVQVFKKVIYQYEQYFTSNWLGLFGSDHITSPGEWEVYLNNSGSFIFYGPNKLTTHVKPSKLTAFNLAKCMLLYQQDLSENYLSFDHQSHVDNSNKDQNLSPLQTAMLLSLAGVRCIIGNQWTSSMEEDADHLQSSMQYLLEDGISTGEALHHIQTPYVKRVNYEETQTEDTKKNSTPNKKSPPKKAEKALKPAEVVEQATSRLLIQEKCFLPCPITDLHQEWFNMVCYGLPNLIVTQIN